MYRFRGKYLECLDIVEEMYKSGAPIREIIERCGGSFSVVYRAINLLEDIGRIERRRRNQRRGWHRLTEEERKRIIDMYMKGETIYRIAKETGRSPSTVKRIIDAYAAAAR